jgi:hypothetical protein
VKKTLISVGLALAYMRFMKRWGDRHTEAMSGFLEEVNDYGERIDRELKRFGQEYMEQRQVDVESMDDFVDQVSRILREAARA